MHCIPLPDEDVRSVLGSLPSDVLGLLTSEPLFLAGGFIRARIARETPNDIDIFAPSREAAERGAKALSGARAPQVRSSATDNAFTVCSPGRVPVQFIHRWTYTDGATLCKEFDFTIAQAVIRAHGKVESWASPRFYQDLAAKRLVYTEPKRDEEAGGSLLRLLKFYGRGYTAPLSTVSTVIARACAAKGDEPAVDFAASGTNALVPRLRQVDPLRVIDGVEVRADEQHEGLAEPEDRDGH